MSDAIIVGGVNGAGKSTILPALQNVTREDWTFEPVHIPAEHFIDPDEIARKHNANGVAAGRLALESFDLHANADLSFAYETTMSGVTLANRLQVLRDRGYRIYMPYVWLDTAELSAVRVAQRALLGGHYIPLKEIQRRYTRCTHNFFRRFRELADVWVIIDNSRLSFRVLGWGGLLYGDPSTVYAEDPDGITRLRQCHDIAREESVSLRSHDLQLPHFEVNTSEVIPLTVAIFDKIRAAVRAQVSRRPAPNLVAVSEDREITFVRPDRISW